MDVRDKIREDKLKEMLEKAWQSISTELQEQNDLMAKNAAKYRKQIDETRLVYLQIQILLILKCVSSKLL